MENCQLSLTRKFRNKAGRSQVVYKKKKKSQELKVFKNEEIVDFYLQGKLHRKQV